MILKEFYRFMDNGLLTILQPQTWSTRSFNSEFFLPRTAAVGTELFYFPRFGSGVSIVFREYKPLTDQGTTSNAYACRVI